MKIVTFAVRNECGEERESHAMHAYINQLAEHDVVSCLHFFPLATALFYRFSSCRSFAPIIYLSLPPIWKLSAEEAEKYITLGVQKRTCVCGALYLKQHHVTYSMQCIHQFYVLAHMWCSAFFFHLSYCHCRIHIKPISFTPPPIRFSLSWMYIIKKQSFTFNIFSPNSEFFYVCIRW